MRKALLISSFLLLLSFVIFDVSAFEGESSVDVNFQILTRSGRTDYYVGDFFWYNITLLNSGSNLINGTFNVRVLNTTGVIVPPARSYDVTIQPNETYSLYPNKTRLERSEFDIYAFKTAGTYTIAVSSDLSLNYYTVFPDGGYAYFGNRFEYPIDVMPSYQREQNDQWSEFLSKNEEYMQKVQENIDKSETLSVKAINLTYLSVCIAVASIFLGWGSFYVAWCDLSKEKQKTQRWWYRVFAIGFLIVSVVLGYMFWLII